MTLKEFLEDRKKHPELAAATAEKITSYVRAVEALLARFKARLAQHKDLELTEWLPLLRESGHRYNAPALTIRFMSDQITLEPVGALLPQSDGRVQLLRGVKRVDLDWSKSEGKWRFRWVTPSSGEQSDLSDEGIDELVVGLLE